MPHPVPPASSSSRPARRGWRTLLLLVAFCVLGTVVALTGCGSATSGAGDAAPSSRPTASSRSTRPEADCSQKAILAALPGGASMKMFGCATSGGTEWAAAQVDPGSTVFFLRWHGGRWEAEEGESVCGSASAGLPASLLSYCRPTSPSTSSRQPTSPPRPAPTSPVTPTTVTCTSASLLAALPQGSRMEKFNCAEVAGKRWAAVRVDPGSTVFFLQSDGRRWKAQDSDGVCDTASAGLPPALLAYCR